MMDQGDRYYIEKVQNSDIQAFSFLVEKHKDMVFSIAFRILKNREDAEELAQDAFIKAYQSLGTFRGESRFGTWLYRIAYNAAVSRSRKKQMVLSELDHRIIENYPTDEMSDELDRLSDEDQKKIVDGLLDTLNPEENSLIMLYYYDNLPTEEIGEIMGLTQSNVKVKLHRLRKKLLQQVTLKLQKTNKEIYQ